MPKSICIYNHTTRMLLFTLIVLTASAQLQAQSKNVVSRINEKQVASNMYTDPATGMPVFIRIDKAANINETRALGFLNELFAQGSDYQWKVKNEVSEPDGSRHIRTRQYYQGVMVDGADYVLHIQNGGLVSMGGNFYPVSKLSTTANIDAPTAREKAFAAALNNNSGNPYNNIGTFGDIELVILPVPTGKTYTYRLCYRVPVKLNVTYTNIYISAADGRFVSHIAVSRHTDATGTATTRYSGQQTITTYKINNNLYELHDHTRGKGIYTRNLQQKSTGWDAMNESESFTDIDNDWKNINNQQDEIATDIHWGLEKTYDYFLNVHGWKAQDNKDDSIIAYAHYSYQYTNAFWTPEGMFFGDGDGIMFTPLTPLDVVAHEFTHGVTNYSSNLGYTYEGAGLNEGFSDVFSACIEYYARPANSNWILGNEMSPQGLYIRNMGNPNASGYSDTYMSPDFDLEPHAAGMILGHCFYLLVNGGSGTNDYQDSYAVQGIGRDKAARIFWRTLVSYLNPFSGYQNACDMSIEAARDIFGECSNEAQQTTEAWKAVGLRPSRTNTLTAEFDLAYTDYCQLPTPVRFANYSTGATAYKWYFGDGTTGTGSRPVHLYQSPGTYSVTMVAYGNCAHTDSAVKQRNNLVSINTSTPCITTLPNTGTAPTMQHCSGTIKDPGADGSYPPNCNSQVSVQSAGADSIVLFFKDIDLDYDDEINVYRGLNKSNFAFSIWQGGAGEYVVAGNAFTLEFKSDGYNEGLGFVLDYYCKRTRPMLPPLVNFNYMLADTCTGMYAFSGWDLEYGYLAGVNFKWFVNGTPAGTGDFLQYVFTTSGTYTVKLEGEYSGLKDVIEKKVLVTLYNSPRKMCIPAEDMDEYAEFALQSVQLNRINYQQDMFGIGFPYLYFERSCMDKTVLQPGRDYPITVALIEQNFWGDYVYNSAAAAWLDMNNDGQFDDASETIFFSAATGAINTGTINIPVTAVQDKLLRMRVAAKGDQFGGMEACPFDNDYIQYVDFGVTVSYNTGIDEQQETDNWLLYPNPTSGLLHLTLPNGVTGSHKISVMNVTGQVVQVINTLKGTGYNTIDMQGYAPGVYMVTITSGQNTYTRKVVKQ